ncbi:MAG: hypothetical protein CL910_14045 [Deltaproteobacteria bacterium]|nr:hypothetical protein [Deltaproteobacteria bacterium]
MDPGTIFWSGALVNMGVIVALAARGVRQIRRDEVAAHRRSMLAASSLVALFLVAYVVKRLAIGAEDLSVWSAGQRMNLYVHESLVATMLIAGVVAFTLGRRLAGTRRVTGRDSDPRAEPAWLRRHRRAGWLAVAGSTLGFATACGILAGMLNRAF